MEWCCFHPCALSAFATSRPIIAVCEFVNRCSSRVSFAGGPRRPLHAHSAPRVDRDSCTINELNSMHVRRRSRSWNKPPWRDPRRTTRLWCVCAWRVCIGVMCVRGACACVSALDVCVALLCSFLLEIVLTELRECVRFLTHGQDISLRMI